MYRIHYSNGKRFSNTRFSGVRSAVRRIESMPGPWSVLQPQNQLDLEARINQKNGVILVVRRAS